MRHAARAVDDRRVAALGGRHRADDRLDAVDLAVVDLRVLDLLGHARQHPEHVLERAHLLDLPHLVEEVLERELALAQLLLGLLHLVLVEGGLGLLDEREHVAHAEDAARHAVGVERLELVELLAGTGEEDRLADDLLHRQRGAAARVAVDLGEDHAVEADGLVELGGDVHRFLTGHRVDDEQRVVAAARCRAPARSSSMSSASICRRPAVSTITTLRPRRAASSSAPRATATGSVGLGVDRDVDALAEHAELLDRGRTLEVGADEQRRRSWLLSRRASLAAAVVFPEPWRPASITTVGGFEAHRELAGGAAEGLDQLLVDDLDELLPGREALRDVRALGALLHPPDEVAGDDGR